MILSSPFSRQNRTHQSWTNGVNHANHAEHGNGIRKPAPLQPAPPKPIQSGPGELGSFRSQTLGRIDLRRARQHQQERRQELNLSVQRNHSSLGNHPAPIKREPQYTNQSATQRPGQIYAPASIASPSELAHYKQPMPLTNGESQHYAATSFKGPYSTASESGRSGRESALGNLLERFGTLRRRAKWSKFSRKLSGIKAAPTGPISSGIPPLPIKPPPTLADPEIYSKGKKKVEAEDIYAEGMHAIDGNQQERSFQYELDESLLSEGETRTLIEEQSRQQPEYQELVSSLTNWINDELAQQRIIVRDIQSDLYDGQILGKLIEKLHQIELDIIEVTQNETVQKYKLRTVLDTINRILSLQARWARIRWSVDGIHSKNLVEIIHLLVTLAQYYRAPIKLPPNVSVKVLVVEKRFNKLVKRSHETRLTDSIGLHEFAAQHQGSRQRDAFDTLVEFAPDKLTIVKQSLVRFVNRHLNKIEMSCMGSKENDMLDPDQFSDGLLLVFLIASLEEYFVPLGNLFTTAFYPQTATAGSQKLADVNNNNGVGILQTALEPTNYSATQPIHKLHNVNVAFQLIEDAGVTIRDRVRAEDIVNGDLKSVLRVLYALFSRYKHV